MIPTFLLYRKDPRKLNPLLAHFQNNGSQCQIHTRSREVIRGKMLSILHIPTQREVRITFEWYATRGLAKSVWALRDAKWTLSPGSLDGKIYTVAFTYAKFYRQRTKDKVNGRVKLKGEGELCWFFPPDDKSNIDVAKLLRA